MKTNKLHKRQFENIYDLIRGTILFDDPARDTTEWGKLTRKHHKEATKEMRAFIRNKNIEWDGDKNIITIGKHFRFQLITK